MCGACGVYLHSSLLVLEAHDDSLLELGVVAMVVLIVDGLEFVVRSTHHRLLDEIVVLAFTLAPTDAAVACLDACSNERREIQVDPYPQGDSHD